MTDTHRRQVGGLAGHKGVAMSLDLKRPKKGYRKAWNGGKPPAMTPAMDAYVAHAESCYLCKDTVCRTCPEAQALFNAAVSPVKP